MNMIKHAQFMIGKAGKDVEGQEVYTALASTGSEDRDGEIIEPSAFTNLNDYLTKNPVIFYDHAWATWDAPQESTMPIGKAVSGSIDPEKGLSLSWQFSGLPFAQNVKKLVDEGILNSVSVGFIPKKWDVDDEGRRVYSEVELLELSVVNIPSNRDAAIIHMSAKGREEVKSLLTDIETEISKSREPEMNPEDTETGAEGGRTRTVAEKIQETIRRS